MALSTPDPTHTAPYIGDEHTDGAASFERAARTAQALGDLPAPPEGRIHTPESRPTPLHWTRVLALLVVVAIGWFATMTLDLIRAG